MGNDAVGDLVVGVGVNDDFGNLIGFVGVEKGFDVDVVGNPVNFVGGVVFGVVVVVVVLVVVSGGCSLSLFLS
jgi:hypothetical protein